MTLPNANPTGWESPGQGRWGRLTTRQEWQDPSSHNRLLSTCVPSRCARSTPQPIQATQHSRQGTAPRTPAPRLCTSPVVPCQSPETQDNTLQKQKERQRNLGPRMLRGGGPGAGPLVDPR